MKWRGLWSRLRGSLRRDDALEREMDQEMAFHLEMSTRRNIERGSAPHVASRQARLAFGSAEAIKEEAREAHRALMAERVIRDVRFALRSLRRSPAFTVAAVVSLALGIGASAATFAAVDAVLLRPLPISHPENFRYLGWEWSAKDAVPALTDLQYAFLRDHNRSFDSVAAYSTQEAHLGDGSRAQPMRGLRVSEGFFAAIGTEPRIGRAFDATEFATGAPVVILSDGAWRAQLGAAPGIVGHTIRLDGESRTVVGVLPPEFRFPPAPEHTGFLVPLAIRADPAKEGNNTNVIGRVRSALPDEVVRSDLVALSGAFRDAHPALADGGSFRVFTHVDAHVGEALRRTLWTLFGAIGLVLLISCANTAILLLVRASARQREIAVRAAIGAGPRRILQQLLTEGVVLSSIATTLGVLAGVVMLRGFVAIAPDALPPGTELRFDLRVLAFAVGVSLVTGVGFGLVAVAPAFRARLRSALVGGGQGGSVGSARLRDALVGLQSAVAVVLLSGAALLTTSFVRLVRVDPGFDADRVVAVRLGLLPKEYDAERRGLLVDRLLERIRALPGVEHAAVTPNLPLERGRNFPVDVPEHPELGTGAVELRFVSPGYLATLGIPLRGGRDFDRNDVKGAEPVAIVNEAFAQRFWQDTPPLDRTIRIGHVGGRWRVPMEARHLTRVIAVTANIHELGLDRPARPTVLVPRAQLSDGTPMLLVRGSSPSLAAALQREVAAEEPRLAPVAERLSAVVSRSVAAPRFRTMLVASFAGFALLLSGIGIYGVIASGVQQRRREIALRVALGASGADVTIAVARRCLGYVAAGVLVGLAGFWALRRVLAPWLYNQSSGDPRVIAASVTALILVAALASWIPTRRARQVDPATALRLD